MGLALLSFTQRHLCSLMGRYIHQKFLFAHEMGTCVKKSNRTMDLFRNELHLLVTLFFIPIILCSLPVFQILLFVYTLLNKSKLLNN